ncbi:MAG: thiamine-phosphate kinase [Leptospira sp.]|nr:thiamine-phosphate kinase [Leptospira sp.]
MKESEILQALFGLEGPPEDDCHFIPPNTLVTTDSLVEGTHFLHTWSSPRILAEKLIEVNVSDIAASGGIPNICFLNLGLSDHSKRKAWVNEFSKTLQKRLKFYEIKLVGGDTFYSKNTHLTLTVFGNTKNPWFRTGGEDGDNLYLTGEIGDSELGLTALQNKKKGKIWDKAIQKHLTPKSRLSLVPLLQKFKIHACMDLTDGILQDTEKLAKASSGHLEIQVEKVPHSVFAKKHLGWDGILRSGEELELLLLTKDILPSQIGPAKITPIGKFIKAKGNKKIKSRVEYTLDGKIFKPHGLGFSHF